LHINYFPYTIGMKIHWRNSNCTGEFVIVWFIRPFDYHPVDVHKFEEVVQILVKAHAIIGIAGDVGQHPEG
jgi:hypothetical protein